MKFVQVKEFSPALGSSSPCEIYIKTSDVKVLLLFRPDHLFDENDLDRCKKYCESKSLYIKEADYLLLLQEKANAVKKEITETGKIDHQSGTVISKRFFSSEDILTSEDKLESLVSMASNYVVDLLKSSKDERTKALTDILKGMSTNQSPFVSHANQVAAISTMIALMVEGVSLDNILEINLVAILHGMGLMHISKEEDSFFDQYADVSKFGESLTRTDLTAVKKVIDKHFDGHHKLTTSDNVIFLQHLTLIEQNIDKIKIKNIKNSGILKTLHDFKVAQSSHENAKVSSNPYISSKILVIGDRMVSLLNFYQKSPNFIASAIRDLENLNKDSNPLFDKRILALVGQLA